MVRIGVIGLALGVAFGCDLVEDEEDGLRTSSVSIASDSNGAVEWAFDVADDEDALLLTATVPGTAMAVFYELTDPDGDKVLDAEQLWTQVRSRTGGVFPGGVVSLNWPIQASDGDLKPGRWTALLRTTDQEYYYQPGVETSITALKKVDPSLQEGGLDVDVFYAGGVDADPEFVAATEEAAAYWQDIYAGIGVEVRFTYHSWPNGDLPPPGEGSEAEYEAISDTSPLRAVNVVIVPTIKGYEGFGLYGISGGIPGPLISTGNSAVAVDAGTNAGPDLTFNEEELRIYGETLAHEVGHFIGLFHPVETDYAFYDAVDDTTECSTRSNCESGLGDNLMFPYPVCDFNSCNPQDQLTAGQAEIPQRYVGLD